MLAEVVAFVRGDRQLVRKWGCLSWRDDVYLYLHIYFGFGFGFKLGHA